MRCLQYAARYGRTAALRKFRSVLKNKTTVRPLQSAEIDHNRLDIFVIDSKSGMPLGRPWVTACIDDFTRCILGIYIGFQPPSHLSVVRCLKMSFLPKVGLNAQYYEVKNTWEAHGVMENLSVDNGLEFHCESLEAACYPLGIEIFYCPRKTPWFKGKIERFFRTLNLGVAHGKPGTTFSNIFEKDDYDPAKHALVTLENLRMVVMKWVCDYYHQKPHKGLDDTPPSVVWSANVKLADINVPDDPMLLDAVLGRIEQRVLTHKGIELDGLFYNSTDLVELRRLLGDVLNVEVRVDDGDIGHIMVFSPKKDRIFKVPALRRDYANGLTAWQHKVCKHYAQQHMEGRYDPTAWLEAKARIAELLEDDSARKKSFKTRMRQARYEEDLSQKPAPISDVRPVGSTAPKPIPSMPVTLQRSVLPCETIAAIDGAPGSQCDAVNEPSARSHANDAHPPTTVISVPQPVARRSFKAIIEKRGTELEIEPQHKGMS
jgi:putative transposase